VDLTAAPLKPRRRLAEIAFLTVSAKIEEMLKNGRKERSDRLTQRKTGAWGTISQNLLAFAGRQFRMSAEEARSSRDQNHSDFTYAGVPLLLAAVQSFIIEYEGTLNLQPLSDELSAPRGLAVLLESRYGVTGDFLVEVCELIEIRNEIIHPVPLPPGTPDNWPDYLRPVKRRGLLSTTGDPKADYIMFSQVASHRLFEWAVKVTKKIYEAIVYSNPEKVLMFEPYLDYNFQTLFG